MPRVFSLHTRASGVEMRWKTWRRPPSYTRYSAQAPGKSFTHATSTQGTSRLIEMWRTRLRWVWPAK